MSLLQFGLPGGPELLVIALLLLLLLGVPILVFVVVYRLVARRTNYERRVSRLEREVAELREAVTEEVDGVEIGAESVEEESDGQTSRESVEGIEEAEPTRTDRE
ncbi:MAG: hypothetical protein ABEI99_04535 [Halobaculum sp.]